MSKIDPRADLHRNPNARQEALGIVTNPNFEHLVSSALLGYLLNNASSTDAADAVKRQYRAEGARDFVEYLLSFPDIPLKPRHTPVNDLHRT